MNILILNNKNFLVLWIGKLCLLIGNRFSALVIPWIVLQQTNSPLKTGLITICSQISPLLFSIPAGTYIEQRNKRHVAAISEFIRASIMLFLVITALLNSLNLYIIAFVLLITGFTGLTYRISFNAMLPAVAGRKNILSAHNYIEGADAVGTLIGPVIAGLLFTSLGAGITLSVDVLVIFISMLSILLIREKDLHKGTKPANKSNRDNKSFILEAKKGFSYIFRNRVQKILTLNHFTLNFTTVFIMLLVIIHGKETLNLNITQTGLLITGAGIGNILGVFLIPKLKNVAWVRILVATTTVSSVGVLMFSLTTTFEIAFIGVLIFDGALSMAFVVHGSVTQAVTEDHYLSRVSSSRYVLSGSAALIGSFTAGLVSEYWSSKDALILGFLLMIFTAAITILYRVVNKPVHELKPIK